MVLLDEGAAHNGEGEGNKPGHSRHNHAEGQKGPHHLLSMMP